VRIFTAYHIFTPDIKQKSWPNPNQAKLFSVNHSQRVQPTKQNTSQTIL